MNDPCEDSFKKEIREQVYAIQAEAEFDTTVRLLRCVTENFGVSIDTAFDKLEIGMDLRPRYREKLEQVPDFWETVHRMANMKSIILYNTKKNGMQYPSIKTVIHFVETFGCDPQTTLDILKIPASEQPRYLEKIYWR